MHRLRQAERMFQYAWDRCSANVGSLKRLMVLTLLSSSLALVYGSTTILMEIANQKGMGIVFLSGSMAEVLALFVLGILACVTMYAVSSFYEGALTQRRVLWDYFCATVRDQPAAE